MNIHKNIEINSDIRFGQPCIKGTRISVFDILGWLASGMSNADIVEDFPELSIENINAALLFAADREHRLRLAS